MLKERISRFLEITKVQKLHFANGCGVSITTIRNILAGLPVSPETENKINAYMKAQNMELEQLVSGI